MRNGYDYPAGNGPDLPGQRDEGLRRLRTLTWRVTQLGALATVGIATVFARTAPMQADSQTAPVATPAAPAPSQAPTLAAGHAQSHKAAARKARAAGAAGGAVGPGGDRHRWRPRCRRADQGGAGQRRADQGGACHLRARHPGAAGHHAPGPGADDRRSRPDDGQRVARRGLMPAATCFGEHTSKALGTFATLLVADPAALCGRSRPCSTPSSPR